MSDRRDNMAIVDWLDARFVGDEAGGVDPRAAASFLSDDDEARDHFDRLALADRELCGDDSTPSAFEQDFGRDLFDARLDALLEEESEPAEVVQLRPRRPVGAWASAAAVLLVSAFAWMSADQVTSADAFQARTAAAPSHAMDAAGAPRLSLFCVERTVDGPTFRGGDDAPFGVLECPNDAELKLAVDNPDPRFRWAAFFGVSEQGRVVWYGPSPADENPVAIEYGEQSQPVGETIRLTVNHTMGEVRVHAIFSEEPIPYARMERWVESRGARLYDHHIVLDSSEQTSHSRVFDVVEKR